MPPLRRCRNGWPCAPATARRLDRKGLENSDSLFRSNRSGLRRRRLVASTIGCNAPPKPRSRAVYHDGSMQVCQRQIGARVSLASSLNLRPRRRRRARVQRLARNGVAASEPAAEVDFGAGVGAEGPELRARRLAADRAFGARPNGAFLRLGAGASAHSVSNSALLSQK